jgi:hypothetical protein
VLQADTNCTYEDAFIVKIQKRVVLHFKKVARQELTRLLQKNKFLAAAYVIMQHQLKRN